MPTEEQETVEKLQGLTVAQMQRFIQYIGVVCQNATIQPEFKKEIGLLLLRYGINCLEQIGAGVQAVVVHPNWPLPMTYGTSLDLTALAQYQETDDPEELPPDEEESDDDF